MVIGLVGLKAHADKAREPQEVQLKTIGESVKIRKASFVELGKGLMAIRGANSTLDERINGSIYLIGCCLLNEAGEPAFKNEQEAAKEIKTWTFEVVTELRDHIVKISEPQTTVEEEIKNSSTPTTDASPSTSQENLG